MCKACQTNSVWEFTNKRKLCRGCFIKYFQKKLFYTIRKFKMIKNGDVVGYGNKGDFRGVVLEHILLIFAGKAMVGLVKLPSKIKVSKTAVSDTLDSNSHNFVSALINSNLKDLEKIKPVVDIKGKIIVKPLYLFLDREVLLYAKLKKLKFKEGKIKKNNICSFIDKLEQKHPEVKSAVIKGYIESFS